MISSYLKALCSLVVHTFLKSIPFRSTIHYDVTIVRADAIGDFVMWMGAIDSYRKKYQGKRVLLICSKADKEIVEPLGFFTDVITFNRAKLANDIGDFYHFMREMKTISSDVVINPVWDHTQIDDFICGMIQSPCKYASKVKRDITVNGWLDNVTLKLVKWGVLDMGKWYYNNLLPMPDHKTTSEQEAIQAFTRQLIDSEFNYRLANLSHITKDYVCSIEGDYCFVSLSSSRVLKDWPIESFSALLKHVPSGYAIVLSGFGVLDEKKAEYLVKENRGKQKVLNYVNKTTVKEMIGLISCSSFVISNDSAAIHIAAACRVPSLCFMHGAHFGRFAPYPDIIPENEYHPRCVFKKMDCYGCGYKCNKDFDPNKPFYCLRQVTVDMAKVELSKLLEFVNSK